MEICSQTGRMIAIQTRATNSLNTIFKFNECSPLCGCNKDICQNYLMDSGNKKQYKLQITRLKKGSVIMWGLIALEEIAKGAYVMEYRGEVITKKQADMRGSYYDTNGVSYLFDMNEPLDEEKIEQKIQCGYNDEFFPLCIDSMFYGNEARFINHICDPNI